MKFSVGSVLAFAAAVLAKPILLNSNYDIQEGKPFTLQWSNSQGPVTITLMMGPSDNLQKVVDITSGVTGSSYTFTLDNIPSGTYAIRITDSSGEPNYSKQFSYVGTGTLSTTLSSASTTATRSSTKSSASSTTASSTSSSSSSSSSTESSSTTSSASSTSSSFTTTTTSAPSTTRAASSSTSAPPNTNNGQRFASPLALVAVTVAALVFFN